MHTYVEYLLSLVVLRTAVGPQTAQMAVKDFVSMDDREWRSFGSKCFMASDMLMQMKLQEVVFNSPNQWTNHSVNMKWREVRRCIFTAILAKLSNFFNSYLLYSRILLEDVLQVTLPHENTDFQKLTT